LFTSQKGACPALLMKSIGRGCLVSTGCTFQNMQVDQPCLYRKTNMEDISANFISKARASFAQAFASFAPALA